MEEGLPRDPEGLKEQSSECKDWQHDYPDQEFEVGPRVCQRCGHREY